MNVLEALNKRLEIIFNDFDNILVAFSGGKDSGVLLDATYRYAKQNNLIYKFNYYYQDYEAGYKYTHEYIERIFDNMEANNKYWICLPIKAACSVSMYEPQWIPWNKDEKDIWTRKMPKNDYVVNEDNVKMPFKKGMKGFDMRIEFANWFANTYGDTAVLVGIRADESLTRRTIFTSPHRAYMHKDYKWSKIISNNLCNFYPVYDFKVSDIWKYNYEFNADYNKLYDLYYKAGLTPDQMRLASPFHQCGQDNLKLYKVIDPDNWGRMVGRVNGCNFGGIYGGTSAMGWKKISKPEHFTWKQYAEFLISTLPEKTKKKFLYHLGRLQESWEKEGYGRNPRVIKAMEDEGIELEKTGEISKLCTKPDVYEIVKIKSGFPDETNVHHNFRICPSWKSVCITIMKNDFSLTYMGVSRSKDNMILREKGMEKYRNLQNIKKLVS